MACGTKEWSNKVISWICFKEPRNKYDLDVCYLMRSVVTFDASCLVVL